MIELGDTAPEFTLEGAVDGEVGTFTLSDALEERPVLLSFYIYDYSPVCTEQMCEMNDMEFLTFNDDAAVFGISTDGPYSHMQFAEDNNLSYPLLTDTDKVVYEQYGMMETTAEGNREPRRGIIVVDRDRTVQYRWVADDNWDTWEIEPLNEANNVVKELVSHSSPA